MISSLHCLLLYLATDAHFFSGFGFRVFGLTGLMALSLTVTFSTAASTTEVRVVVGVFNFRTVYVGHGSC